MLAVCAGADGGFDTVLEALLGELAEGKDDSLRLIGRVGLDGFLWDQVARLLGYRADKPSLSDFAITLFKSCYRVAIGEEAILAPDALVFFRRWKNNRNAERPSRSYRPNMPRCWASPQDLAKRDFRTLIEVDYFEEVDRAIIRALVHEVSAKPWRTAEVLSWIRQRRQSHWYGTYRDLYEAIGFAAEFQHAMAQASLGMASLAEGVQRYAKSWFRIDQLYRKFIWHMQKSGQATLMRELFEQVENHYVNSYLLRLNDAWQVHVDTAAAVVGAARSGAARLLQRPCGRIPPARPEDLRHHLRRSALRDRRRAAGPHPQPRPLRGRRSSRCLASLPSYTQLGMASLLPNGDLQIADNDTGMVLVDGQSSQGLDNRRKILATGRAGRSDHGREGRGSDGPGQGRSARAASATMMSSMSITT